jgi:ABC-type antimicrobial peptide transport system permease subunit
MSLLVGLGSDVRYAMRSLRRRPLLMLVAVAVLALGRAASTLLFGVGPLDARTMAGAAAVLASVAAVACYLPARRAARLDPATALRRE